MAEVLVIVNVKVLVWELNSQTTVAVEKLPLSTPTTVMVSAFAVALTQASTPKTHSVRKSLRYRDIHSSLFLKNSPRRHPHVAFAERHCRANILLKYQLSSWERGHRIRVSQQSVNTIFHRDRN